MRALSDVDVTRMKELQAWLLALYLGFGFMASSGLYSSRCPLPASSSYIRGLSCYKMKVNIVILLLLIHIFIFKLYKSINQV